MSEAEPIEIKFKNIGRILHENKVEIPQGTKKIAFSVVALKFQELFVAKKIHFSSVGVTVIFCHEHLELSAPLTVGVQTSDQQGNVKIRVSGFNQEDRYENLSFSLLICPFVDESEADVWKRIDTAAITAVALEGNRLFQAFIYKAILDVDSNNLSEDTGSQPFPTFPVIYKSPEAIVQKLMEICDKDFRISPIREALSWFRRSLESNDLALKFLSAWIACETLAESSDTDVSKISKLVHAHLSKDPKYAQKTPQETQKHLLLGRLHGVRGEVAHRGKIDRVNELVATYAQILFAEMLFGVFNTSQLGLILSFLTECRDKLEQAIHKQR